MSDCCTKASEIYSFPKKHVSPGNGKEYNLVTEITIKHNIKSPWSWEPQNQGYYFCSDPSCSVVYFSQDNVVIEKSTLRSKACLEANSGDALVCYCYGIKKSDALNNPEVRNFVVEETKRHNCACETSNPSGKCCLSDFPKLQKN